MDGEDAHDSIALKALHISGSTQEAETSSTRLLSFQVGMNIPCSISLFQRK